MADRVAVVVVMVVVAIGVAVAVRLWLWFILDSFEGCSRMVQTFFMSFCGRSKEARVVRNGFNDPYCCPTTPAPSSSSSPKGWPVSFNLLSKWSLGSCFWRKTGQTTGTTKSKKKIQH